MSARPSADQLVRSFQSELGEIREIRVPWGVRFTLLVTVLMFVSLGIIAACFRIDRVVTSITGQIVTVDPTVVMQALDPSIIKTINIHEGERVVADQLLATLDPTFTQADLDAAQQAVDALDAQIARCEAELGNRPFILEPGKEPGNPLYARIQLGFYNQRKAQFEAQNRANQALVTQAQESIARLQADRAGYAYRLQLNREIEKMRSDLVGLQLESKLLLLQASDTTADLKRNMDLDDNLSAEAQQQLLNAIGTRDAFVQQWEAQTSQELVTARTQRDTAVQALEKAIRHRELVHMTAPNDAIVLRLARLSVGSVLNAGDSLIELARLDSDMEAEIYVDPRDVGFIRPGDPVVIKLDPYNYVEHGWASGRVRWISEGTFSIMPTGTGGMLAPSATSTDATQSGTLAQNSLTSPFYKARIAITTADLKNVPPSFRLMPGMTLTADIHVGTRSLLTYLLKDIIRVFDEPMREP